MNHSIQSALAKATDARSATVEAIKAWHRGEQLSVEQKELIESSRVQCLARAHGVDL